ncbi:SH3 domain-containing protein [Streptomyces sp. NPDC059783]|uniref:SH3 domain-containing protein n=1 Tax=Streptomyces sp. NPDC059783 TaxID=3346944 RepID=UPI003665735C
MKTLTRRTLTRLSAALALTLAMSGAAAVTATSSQSTSVTSCYITASPAYTRSKPRTDSTIVGVVHRGRTCTALDYSYPGSVEWAKNRVNKTGVVGWARDDLVHPPGMDITICLPGTC